MSVRHPWAWQDKISRAEMGESMGKKYWMRGWPCAALAAACFLAALPGMNLLARERIDQARECSLTVKTDIIVTDTEEGNSDWSELETEEIKVYLYRVAEVNEYGEYQSTAGYEGLELEKIESSMKADDWREKARDAADMAGLPIPPRAEDVGDGNLGGGNGLPGNNGQQSGNSQSAGTPNGAEEMELPADLPDKLAGADASVTLQNGIGTVQGLAQGMYLVWVMPVYTDEYQYTFLPYLVSLPNNSYDASIPDSRDEWDYEPSVGLKPRQNTLYGNLLIRKRLDTYNPALGEAMFVFRVEARKDLDHDGEKEIVYSNVVGLEFGESGQKEAVIENIPAGAEVTVEEVYSGSAYTLLGTEKIQATVIRPENSTEEWATVDFTNTYDNRITYGTGAVNRFAYNDGGWSGNRVTGNEGGGSQ